MLIYCIVCYLVMLGIMIESHRKEGVPFSTWMIWLFSPIILPIIVGMMLAEKHESNE